MGLAFTLPCPGYPFTRRGLRVSIQSPSESGVVLRRQLDDYELRSWILRWVNVPEHLYVELERLYEDSDHGILPFSYQPPEEPSEIEVTMSGPLEVELDGVTASFSVELTEVR